MKKLIQKLGSLLRAPQRMLENKSAANEILKAEESSKALNHDNDVLAKQIMAQLDPKARVECVIPSQFERCRAIMIENRAEIYLRKPRIEEIDGELKAVIPFHVNKDGEEMLLFTQKGNPADPDCTARHMDCLRIENQDDFNVLIKQCQGLTTELRKQREIEQAQQNEMGGM